MSGARLFFAGVGVLLVSFAAACAGGSGPEAPQPALVQLPPAAPVGEWVLFGHIRSLERTSGRFEMRFDPAWLLNGVAAERAAVEDKAIAPGDPVPNDGQYTVDEGHRLLTFVVAANAPVTILEGGVSRTRMTVSELALRGFAGGFWIRVGEKCLVLSLDQQYQP